ncbi:steroid receptor RNA activator 1 [Synchiropus splendidus]|uniref:steroid receptor RNA activator 1 n=1 Tax=Synchiropus splendidus TaxID=270530 RepID=UPI00237E3796|nr:steroid receptor RNA activator 1 [Synchiropus splendidus]
MEDMYVKPGNQERGWNDPPQFSYSLQKSHGGQKNLLNKRAPPPGDGTPPMTPPTLFNPLAPPPGIKTAPPAGPPPSCHLTPPAASIRSQKEDVGSQSESEPDVQSVMVVLERALGACRQSVSDQVCNDMGKRLRLLQDSWQSGRLSLPVKRRMRSLSLELQACNWDQADDIHRSLMVDHVTEVSQWMVGVKRLIAETRKLCPELLVSLKDAAEDVSDSAQDSTSDS